MGRHSMYTKQPLWGAVASYLDICTSNVSVFAAAQERISGLHISIYGPTNKYIYIQRNIIHINPKNYLATCILKLRFRMIFVVNVPKPIPLSIFIYIHMLSPHTSMWIHRL